MQIPKNTLVAVADGETLKLYRNTGSEGSPSLTQLPDADVSTSSKGSGGRHQSSSANPNDSQQDEDGFAAGVAALLNKQVLCGKVADVVVVAAPRTLGEMRKYYHKVLEAKLVGEVFKDLTAHSIADIEKAIGVA